MLPNIYSPFIVCACGFSSLFVIVSYLGIQAADSLLPNVVLDAYTSLYPHSSTYSYWSKQDLPFFIQRRLHLNNQTMVFLHSNVPSYTQYRSTLMIHQTGFPTLWTLEMCQTLPSCHKDNGSWQQNPYSFYTMVHPFCVVIADG